MTDLGTEFNNESSEHPLLVHTIAADCDDLSLEKDKILQKINSLQQILIQGELTDIASSELLQLLWSIKKSNPDIHIPLLEYSPLVHPDYGEIHWQIKDHK